MKFSETCIRNPVFTIVLSLMIIIIGLIGYMRLQVMGYPNITAAEIGIHTTLSGASASYVQERISSVIENAVSGVSGVMNVESNSQDGVSDVIVRLAPGVKVDNKINEISNFVAKAASQLPRGITGPDINQANPNSSPIINLFFTSKTLSTLELTDYINRYIIPNFKKVEGIAQTPLFGNEQYALRIWLQPQKMAALHVKVNDILSAITAQNSLSVSGTVQSKDRNYPFVPNAKIADIEGFENIIVTHYQGRNIKLQDLAKVELGKDATTSASFLDGQQGVGLAIIPTSSANPLTVASNTYKVLNQIKSSLPSDIHYQVGFDLTHFLEQSIHTTYETLILAAVLVILVVFLFIGSLRASIIPIITLPICLCGSFIFLYWMGFTLNVITLLSLVIAVGLIVDDAIIIVENIHRHIQAGLTPFAAAIKGAHEIGFAIIVITLTLAAVFAPIGFSSGLIGELFWQFAFTVVIAVLLSGVIAISLSPMMCAYLLKKDPQGGYTAHLNHKLGQLSALTARVVSISIAHKRSVICLYILLLVLGAYLYYDLPKMLAPESDQGSITVPMHAMPNASLTYMKNHALEVSQVLSQQKDAKKVMVNLGEPNAYQGNATLVLKPMADRKKTQAQIESDLQSKLNQIPGIIASPAPPPPLGIGGQGGFPMEFILSTQNSFTYLYQVAQRVMDAIKQNKKFTDVNTNIQFNEAQYHSEINRNLAADLGVNVSDITNALAVFMGNYIAGKYYYNEYPYDIVVSSLFNRNPSPNSLESIYVPTASGAMVPISSFLSTHIKTVPTVLSNYNQMHALHIMANLREGYSQSSAIDFIKHTLKANLPNDVSYTWFGQTKSYIDSSSTMLLNLILGILFVYLLLSAQFASFRQPLIILISVPLALVGALIALYITGNSLNIFSQIGLITLVGLISKHGILITEFANQLVAQGMSRDTAIVESVRIRLKPILMTTAAMVLGAVPLVFGSGSGYEYREQLGVVIIGGLLIGTVMTLFILPVLYLLLQHKERTLTV